MSRGKSLGLSLLFQAISVFVSGSLVLSARGAHGQQVGSIDVLHLTQRA